MSQDQPNPEHVTADGSCAHPEWDSSGTCLGCGYNAGDYPDVESAEQARIERLQAQMQSEAAEIAYGHGWDAANYGYAYGSDRDETVTEQAARRAKERYPDGTQVRFLGAVRQEYREAFLAGHAAFHADLNEAFGPEED